MPTIMETDKECDLCHHSLKDNLHGFDQNDYWMDGDKLMHSGRCTYCRICNPELFKKYEKSS